MKSSETAYMGQLFGRLTVLREAGRSKISGNILWECQCSCGNVHVCSKSSVTNGSTKSCGCFMKEQISTHGLSKHPAWTAYKCARDRCIRKKNKHWKDYGGRGVEFKLGTIDVFLSVMVPLWFKGATLDRKDNNGHYEYNNIRWVTAKEQSRNRRDNVIVTYCNVTLPIVDWAKELGLSPPGFARRLRAWGIERAITTPVIRRQHA